LARRKEAGPWNTMGFHWWSKQGAGAKKGGVQATTTSAFPLKYFHVRSYYPRSTQLDIYLTLTCAGLPPTLSLFNGTEMKQRTDETKLLLSLDESQHNRNEGSLEVEPNRKWILNLSMHFRDKSDREKFFVTYAETPNLWRRVTVSCDYRTAEPDSLEKDLKELQFQRDKSGRIYESIRESLPEIQFYPTVTNLKLQTSDGRLHVHVTEDVNEIIPFPAVSTVQHLDQPALIRDRNMLVRESELEFVAHLSGFVYKVRWGKHDFIKKEIPGPDTVDEFLYEINALHALSNSESVIKFERVIVDDNEEVVKGLLISYAERGALVDLLFDCKGQMEWSRRERWARQIVQGLMEIHEAGYVQGDFTLSNIVVDLEDKAKIIDINRRGCPVGWEPPEINKKIESNQRISMYIGVKSDIFQLGMTLWALAMEHDEPERQDRPLTLDNADPEIPSYYRTLVELCLAYQPQDRPSAKELIAMFPILNGNECSIRFGEQFIDPSQTVGRDDIENELSERPKSCSMNDGDLIDGQSCDSGGSHVIVDVRPSESFSN
jgi:Protein kinase domain